MSQSRLVLTGVPPVGFYGTVKRGEANLCPEDFTFAACLRAVAEYLGNRRLGCEHIAGEQNRPVGCGYKYLLGVSGQAFAVSWNTRSWDYGNGSFSRTSTDVPGAIRASVAAIGYECSIVTNTGPREPGLEGQPADEPAMRLLIRDAVEAGYPLLALGVVGPPEWCCVYGYDEDGDVLVGRSFFQDFPEFAEGIEKESDGSFRRRDWFGNTYGLVLLTAPVAPPSLPATFRRAIARGIATMELRSVGRGYATGQAAFDAWIDAVRRADDRSAWEEPPAIRHEVHRSQVGSHAEARAYGGEFLQWAADALPEAGEPLRRAAGCFAREHDLMWKVWEQEADQPARSAYPHGSADAFARTDVRDGIARTLARARDADAAALAYLREANDILTGRIRGATGPTEHQLAGVSYIGFDAARSGGEAKTNNLCAAAESALAFLGEEYPYSFLMGVSGAAFRLTWNAGRWDCGNLSMLTVGADPAEGLRRIARATGWSLEIAGNASWQVLPAAGTGEVYRVPGLFGAGIAYRDEAWMRRRIIEAIRYRGYPVLGIGIVVPTAFCVLTGYEQDADILVGMSHFQSSPANAVATRIDDGGRFHTADWYADTAGIALFAHKTARPTLSRTYRDALSWAVDLIRTPRYRGHYHGLGAYDAWAQALERHEAFPEDAPAILAQRLRCHTDALRAVTEGRRHAVAFLEAFAEACPEAAGAALAAAAEYRREQELLAHASAALGGFGYAPEKARALAVADTRLRIAELVREARALEERAAAHIAEAAEAPVAATA